MTRPAKGSSLVTALAVAALASPVLGQGRCGPVGALSIHACHYPGDGPTIVLAAGAGQSSRTWDPLVDELLTLGSVVTFDRPGLGRSPAVDGPRSPTAIARELRDVVTALGVSGPMLVVGHSMGGVHVLRYADLFSESVAGVVLLDTPPRGFEQERMSLLSSAERNQRLDALAERRARSPNVVGLERDGAASEPWEFSNFPEAAPLFVVVAGSQDFGELGSREAHRALWLRMSERWLPLSAHGELVVAAGSGHMVHHDRARLVIDVIHRLVCAIDRCEGALHDEVR